MFNERRQYNWIGIAVGAFIGTILARAVIDLGHLPSPVLPVNNSLVCELPIRTTNPLNGSQGFSRGAAMGAAKRRKAQRSLAKMVLWANLRPIAAVQALLPCVVTLTRVAPSSGLDPHDALPASLKGAIDGVADALGLTNDRDPRVQWRFDQRRGKPREYAVIVKVEWPDWCRWQLRYQPHAAKLCGAVLHVIASGTIGGHHAATHDVGGSRCS
jgi:hypothetical protein